MFQPSFLMRRIGLGLAALAFAHSLLDDFIATVFYRWGHCDTEY